MTFIVDSGAEHRAIEMLKRCHGDEAALRWCSQQEGDAQLWFSKSGRKYPIDDQRSTFSPTLIRTHLDQKPKEEVHDAIKDLAFDVHNLLSYLAI